MPIVFPRVPVGYDREFICLGRVGGSVCFRCWCNSFPLISSIVFFSVICSVICSVASFFVSCVLALVL